MKWCSDLKSSAADVRNASACFLFAGQGSHFPVVRKLLSCWGMHHAFPVPLSLFLFSLAAWNCHETRFDQPDVRQCLMQSFLGKFLDNIRAWWDESFFSPLFCACNNEVRVWGLELWHLCLSCCDQARGPVREGQMQSLCLKWLHQATALSFQLWIAELSDFQFYETAKSLHS